MSTTREQLIAVLKAMPSTGTGPQIFDTVLDFLVTVGYEDVAQAMRDAMNTTSVQAKSALSSTISDSCDDYNYTTQNARDRTVRP